MKTGNTIEETEFLNKTTASDTEPPRTRRKPMLWQKLGVDKDPEFNDENGKHKHYFLVNYENNEAIEYAVGYLHSITQSDSGKKYEFCIMTNEGVQGCDTFTHYCEPVNP